MNMDLTGVGRRVLYPPVGVYPVQWACGEGPLARWCPQLGIHGVTLAQHRM